MLYIDTTLINNHGGNVAATDYVLSIMNIVSLYLTLYIATTLMHFRIITTDYVYMQYVYVCILFDVYAYLSV